MVRLSGQRGVPVTTVDDQVVVGFDRRRLESIIAQEAPTKPRLGAAVADAGPRVHIDGAYVGRVLPDSPAAQAGLRVGDVIVEVNRKPVRSAAELESLARSLRAGQKAGLVYVRHGRVLQGDLCL